MNARPKAPPSRDAQRAERRARVARVRRGAAVHGDGRSSDGDVRAVRAVETRETAADGVAVEVRESR